MKRIKHYFKTYPESNECHVTSDGTIFHKRHSADAHAASLADKKVKGYRRSDDLDAIEKKEAEQVERRKAEAEKERKFKEEFEKKEAAKKEKEEASKKAEEEAAKKAEEEAAKKAQEEAKAKNGNGKEK